LIDADDRGDMSVNIGHHRNLRIEWPSTPEEYAVLAMRLQGEEPLRQAYTRVHDGCPAYQYSSSLSSSGEGKKARRRRSCIRVNNNTAVTDGGGDEEDEKMADVSEYAPEHGEQLLDFVSRIMRN
jgi:hypothetical protein